MPDTQAEKILVVAPSWVGDTVMAHGLIQVLAGGRAKPLIHVFAPARTRPLAERMAEVAAVIESPFGSGELRLAERRRLGRRLGEAGYSRAIVLPNSFKSALLPWFARIPRRVGWVGEARWPLLNDIRRLDPSALPQMAQRFAALACPPATAVVPRPRLTNGEQAIMGHYPAATAVPRPRLTVQPEARQQALARLGLTMPERLLSLCPGAAYGAAKRWPARHFARLAEAFLERGWQVWLFGARDDQDTAAQVMERIAPALRPRCRNLAGRTSLTEAIDLLSLSAVVVSNDSGLLHVAAATGRSVVAIYGSTTPDFTPPLAERVKLLATDIGCRPCFRRECPYGHLHCLTELVPDRAIQAVLALAREPDRVAGSERGAQ